jgi:hypothetical protein
LTVHKKKKGVYFKERVTVVGLRRGSGGDKREHGTNADGERGGNAELEAAAGAELAEDGRDGAMGRWPFATVSWDVRGVEGPGVGGAYGDGGMIFFFF